MVITAEAVMMVAVVMRVGVSVWGRIHKQKIVLLRALDYILSIDTDQQLYQAIQSMYLAVQAIHETIQARQPLPDRRTEHV